MLLVREICQLAGRMSLETFRHQVGPFAPLLRWDAAAARCLLTDLDSRNGTHLNGRAVREAETPVLDGDVLRFGDAEFVFLDTGTLHARLRHLPR